MLIGVTTVGVIVQKTTSPQVSDQPITTATQTPIATKEASVSVPSPVPSKSEVKYEVITPWSSATGAGKILISKTYLNKAGMEALGEQLKQDYASEKSVNIRVFTDAKAALLYDKVIAEQATPAEDALYTKNFVAWYKKNGSNGYHEFDTFIGGVLGSHNPIQY